MSNVLVVWVLAAAPFLVVLAGVALVLRYRRRIQERLYAGTGLLEWYQIAREMPRADRWKVARDNARGRASEPRLASYAVRRAEVMIAVNQKHATSGFTRWLPVFLGLVLAFNVAVAVRVVASGRGDTGDWVVLGLQLALLVVWVVLVAYRRRLSRRTERRLRESLRRNRELLGQDQP